MAGAKLFALIAVFFVTSVVSVVTGSTSLITVPLMIGLGIEAHIAVATNMLALTFMSVGGSLPFVGRGIPSRRHLLPGIVLTVIMGIFSPAVIREYQQFEFRKLAAQIFRRS